MSNERKDIRVALLALMVANPQTMAGTRVFVNETRPVSADTELPCMMVNQAAETIELYDAPRRYKRSLRIEIVAIAAQATGAGAPLLDDVIDAFAQEIETKLALDEYLGGAAAASRHVGTEFEFSGEGRKRLGAASLAYEFDFLTEAPTDQAGALEALERVGVQNDVAPSDGSIEAEDLIEVPQE